MSSKCVKVPEKLNGNVPPYHARDCQGQVKQGIDGKWYVSQKKVDGTWFWTASSSAVSAARATSPGRGAAAARATSPGRSAAAGRPLAYIPPITRSREVSPPPRPETKYSEVRMVPHARPADYPGEKMEGKDGSMYISKTDKRGYYRWTRVDSPASPRASSPAPCARIPDDRITTKNVPPYHARDCQGQTKEGQDKRMYISKQKAGTYTWYWSPVEPLRPTSPVRSAPVGPPAGPCVPVSGKLAHLPGYNARDCQGQIKTSQDGHLRYVSTSRSDGTWYWKPAA